MGVPNRYRVRYILNKILKLLVFSFFVPATVSDLVRTNVRDETMNVHSPVHVYS